MPSRLVCSCARAVVRVVRMVITSARGAPEIQQILRNVNETTREIRVLLAKTEEAAPEAEA